jgi:hypothetical protein
VNAASSLLRRIRQLTVISDFGMARGVAEEAAALTSLVLFLSMIAIWAAVIATL